MYREKRTRSFPAGAFLAPATCRDAERDGWNPGQTAVEPHEPLGAPDSEPRAHAELAQEAEDRELREPRVFGSLLQGTRDQEAGGREG